MPRFRNYPIYCVFYYSKGIPKLVFATVDSSIIRYVKLYNNYAKRETFYLTRQTLDGYIVGCEYIQMVIAKIPYGPWEIQYYCLNTGETVDKNLFISTWKQKQILTGEPEITVNTIYYSVKLEEVIN
jgi:hypothetical protein